RSPDLAPPPDFRSPPYLMLVGLRETETAGVGGGFTLPGGSVSPRPRITNPLGELLRGATTERRPDRFYT
ncbi:MAG: hypothetical protein ACC658_15075, partial [Acidimicrobiia bacterium]